ncbi:hypothetical protein BIW11_01673 [Tropilaelaps mercedesae]|uniref:Uncharacterized protein n=1 Tax=Tropilaelaps mercedesae TaxID=418985 RepID=A0A1V9XA90_9ACAR|nr:hypothetical protein BIW11_01673 [Tropilaelaps mercedesae]
MRRYLTAPLNSGQAGLVLLLACLLQRLSLGLAAEERLSMFDSRDENNICSFDCVREVVHNKRLVALIVLLSKTGLNATRINTYVNLIPEDIKVFLHKDSDVEDFLEDLYVTVQQASRNTSDTMSWEVKNVVKALTESIQVEELEEITQTPETTPKELLIKVKPAPTVAPHLGTSTLETIEPEIATTNIPGPNKDILEDDTAEPPKETLAKVFLDQPRLESTEDGQVVVIFRGQRFAVPNDLPKISTVLENEQVLRLVATLSLMGVPVEVENGKVVVTEKPLVPDVLVQPIGENRIEVHVRESKFVLPEQAHSLKLLWQQHPEYLYTIFVGYPGSVVGPPLLWHSYLTDHVLLTQELARTHYRYILPSHDIATMLEQTPSYEFLTTTDGQLVIRVEGQTLQVPGDLPLLATLVSPTMLVAIVTRLQQIGIPVQVTNNRVMITREASTSYSIEVEVRSRGGRLVSIIIVMNGERFELPRDTERFQQLVASEPVITFQLFKCFERPLWLFASRFSPYSITTEQGRIIIHILDESFEVPQDLQKLASILDHQSLLVTTMRGQPIKAIVSINNERFRLPADEERFQAFLAKEPSINYKIFQLLSSKNIPISYDNETRRVRIKFAAPAQIMKQGVRRLPSNYRRSPSQAMSASAIFG